MAKCKVYIRSEVVNHVVDNYLPKLTTELVMDNMFNWLAAKHRVINGQHCVYLDGDMVKELLSNLSKANVLDIANDTLLLELCSAYSNYLKRVPFGEPSDYIVVLEDHVDGNKITNIKSYRFVLGNPEVIQILGNQYPTGLREAKQFAEEKVGIGPVTFSEASRIVFIIRDYVGKTMPTRSHSINPIIKQIGGGIKTLAKDWEWVSAVRR